MSTWNLSFPPKELLPSSPLESQDQNSQRPPGSSCSHNDGSTAQLAQATRCWWSETVNNSFLPVHRGELILTTSSYTTGRHVWWSGLHWTFDKNSSLWLFLNGNTKARWLWGQKEKLNGIIKKRPKQPNSCRTRICWVNAAMAGIRTNQLSSPLASPKDPLSRVQQRVGELAWEFQPH